MLEKLAIVLHSFGLNKELALDFAVYLKDNLEEDAGRAEWYEGLINAVTSLNLHFLEEIDFYVAVFTVSGTTATELYNAYKGTPKESSLGLAIDYYITKK